MRPRAAVYVQDEYSSLARVGQSGPHGFYLINEKPAQRMDMLVCFRVRKVQSKKVHCMSLSSIHITTTMFKL